jgi:branched-chain amino acid transport system ATP-binding protein
VSDRALLEVQDLCTYYGRSQALFNMSLKVPPTGAIAILGRNGAGKTTLLQSIAGELRPRKGRIVIDGEDCTHLPTERRAGRGLGYVPQQQSVFSGLSVRENLTIGAFANSDSHAIDQSLALFPKLADRLDQIAGTLSGGERKMLAIGRALLGGPKLLLLDEPTEGVWMGVIEEIADRLTNLRKNIALVIVEQHLELALSIANYVYVMDRGRISLEGPADKIKRSPELLRLLAP